VDLKDVRVLQFRSIPNPVMRAINRTTIVKAYKGKWIALKDDQRSVVASGRSVKAVLEEARKKGHRNPIITRVPRLPIRFIGTAATAM
jgi:hypothetical protein